MKPNLDKLENLTDDQLQKISADVKKIGIRQTAAEASRATHRQIDKTCIQRFDERSIARHFLVETPDTAAAAAEILRFAVTGRPDFCDATIKVLEESAFKLALVCTRSEKEMKALNQISTMLCRFRSTAVRERMAKIQEDKAQLRREEFEWKKSVALNKSSNRKGKSGQAEDPEEDELGRIARNLDDIERRACKKFNLPYHGPRQEEDESPVDDGTADAPVATTSRASRLSPTESAPYLQPENNRSLGSPDLETTTTPASANPPIPAQGADEPLYLQQEKNPHSAILKTQSPDATPYLQSEKNHAEASARIPSPTHPSIPAQAAGESPYLQTEKKCEDSQAITREKPAEPPTPAHHVGFPALVIAHAIKRWRAHIPRPKGTPEPDGSWRQECPCGHPLPCAQHGELPNQARAYKPQHPDYKFHLDQVGVPYYIPTAEEIGCTQAALDR